MSDTEAITGERSLWYMEVETVYHVATWTLYRPVMEGDGVVHHPPDAAPSPDFYVLDLVFQRR